jgi:hypothetical protein
MVRKNEQYQYIGIPAYFLWNWIVPDIFSLPEIGFFQMLGLIVLINCLLGRGFISLDTST